VQHRPHQRLLALLLTAQPYVLMTLQLQVNWLLVHLRSALLLLGL